MTLLELQEYFLHNGNVKAVLCLWDIFSPSIVSKESLEWFSELSLLWKGSLESFIRFISKRQIQGFPFKDDLLKWLQFDVLPRSEEQDQLHFIEWVEKYCEQQLQMDSSALQHTYRLFTLLENLRSLTGIVAEFPFAPKQNFTERIEHILKIHHYLNDLCTLATTSSLFILPSPSAELPSNEELVLQLLNEIQNVDTLPFEFQTRVVPFCSYRKLSVDEVLSFYVKQLLENAGTLEMARIEKLWRMIQSFDMRIKVLQGAVARRPPFPLELLHLFEESSQYHGDVSIQSHTFITEQCGMLKLRNRVVERGMDALIYSGDHAGFVVSEALISRWVVR